MPHLNSAHKTDFDPGGMYPALRDVVISFFLSGIFSLSNFPKFSLDLACAYGTFKYAAGRDSLKHQTTVLCDIVAI